MIVTFVHKEIPDMIDPGFKWGKTVIRSQICVINV